MIQHRKCGTNAIARAKIEAEAQKSVADAIMANADANMDKKIRLNTCLLKHGKIR